ncbi:MAG: hypothetical protein N4A36_04480 [Candidatus Gracilibacteria bacterium]|jgi:hypothetical protein|nr:hypothetical protein [Candidatus Gracilibacteria bacterium]
METIKRGVQELMDKGRRFVLTIDYTEGNKDILYLCRADLNIKFLSFIDGGYLKEIKHMSITSENDRFIDLTGDNLKIIIDIALRIRDKLATKGISLYDDGDDDFEKILAKVNETALIDMGL